jgi:hypothetical protein
MVAFDTPTREFCVSRRPRTNTPLQALVTLNDPAFVEAAAALARRMLEHAESGEPAPTSVEFLEREAVRYGFRRALARAPDASEEEALMELYREALAGSDSLEDAARLSALTVVANAIMNLDEFITRG